MVPVPYIPRIALDFQDDVFLVSLIVSFLARTSRTQVHDVMMSTILEFTVFSEGQQKKQIAGILSKMIQESKKLPVQQFCSKDVKKETPRVLLKKVKFGSTCVSTECGCLVCRMTWRYSSAG